MKEFSERTYRLLRFSGWYIERSVDIQQYQSMLSAGGYEVFPVVEDILSIFGGLRIIYPADCEQGVMGEILFEPSVALKMVPINFVRKCGYKINKKLCLVGLIYETDALLIAEDGTVYNAFDDHLNLIGNNIVDSLENVLRIK